MMFTKFTFFFVMSLFFTSSVSLFSKEANSGNEAGGHEKKGNFHKNKGKKIHPIRAFAVKGEEYRVFVLNVRPDFQAAREQKLEKNEAHPLLVGILALDGDLYVVRDLKIDRDSEKPGQAGIRGLTGDICDARIPSPDDIKKQDKEKRREFLEGLAKEKKEAKSIGSLELRLETKKLKTPAGKEKEVAVLRGSVKTPAGEFSVFGLAPRGKGMGHDNKEKKGRKNRDRDKGNRSDDKKGHGDRDENEPDEDQDEQE